MAKTTKRFESLSDACGWLRANGYTHNLATWTWFAADGTSARTDQGELTKRWTIRFALTVAK